MTDVSEHQMLHEYSGSGYLDSKTKSSKYNAPPVLMKKGSSQLIDDRDTDAHDANEGSPMSSRKSSSHMPIVKRLNRFMSEEVGAFADSSSGSSEKRKLVGQYTPNYKPASITSEAKDNLEPKVSVSQSPTNFEFQLEYCHIRRRVGDEIIEMEEEEEEEEEPKAFTISTSEVNALIKIPDRGLRFRDWYKIVMIRIFREHPK